MKQEFNQVLWNQINSIDLTRIFDRLVHKIHFTPERAEKAIDGYRKYLYLINTVGNLTPNADADEAWHAHILHLPAYIRDCMSIFGRVIWHIPKPIVDGKVICSGECNAGGPNSNDYKPGTDCEALQKQVNLLSFSIMVPIDEYANQIDQPAPSFEKFVEEHFV